MEIEKLTPVYNWQDMRQFGINMLTGEACAYSMRLLCDVNAAGGALLADYFGITTMAFQGNWNSEVNGERAVGSVMLDRYSLQRLAQFAFFRAGVIAVIVDDVTITPLNAKRLAFYEKLDGARHIVRNPTAGSTQPHEGSRNVHAATGRVV